MKFYKQILFSLLLFVFFNLNAQDLKPKYWKSLNEQGENLLKKDSVKLAYPYLQDAYTIAEAHYEGRPKYGKSLYNFYKVNMYTKSYTILDSLNLTKELLVYSKSLKPSKRSEYSTKIQELADLSLTNRQFQKAIMLYNEYLAILDLVSNSKDSTYAKTLFGLGKSYKGTGKNNIEAKEYLEHALTIVESQDPSQTLKVEVVLIELLPVYLGLRQEDKANKAVKSALSLIENKEGKINEAFASRLYNIGLAYFNARFLDQASHYMSKAQKTFEDLGDYESMYYLSVNYMLGRIEKDNNNYIESIKAFMKVQDVFVKNNKTNNDNYAITLGNIGLNYDRIGDYEKAMLYCNKALEIPEISKITYSNRLMDKGYFYQNMGRYGRSHEVYIEALEAMEISHGKKDPEYAKLLNNIGKLYFVEGKYKDALVYFRDAITIIEVPEGQIWHSFYSYMLNDYSKTLFELGDFEEALKLMKKNVTYFETNKRPKNEEYYNRKFSLAKAYNLRGDYQKALPLIEGSTKMLGEILGKAHVDYGQFLKTLGDTYFGLGMTEQAVLALEQSNSVFVNQIDKIFRFSSENEKKAFIKMLTKNFNQMQSIAISKNLNNDLLNTINLNNQLMLKGLLLNNSKDITFKLKSLEDDAINAKIKSYQELNNKRTKSLTQYLAKSRVEADSLKIIINKREAELVKLYTSNFEGGISLVRDWEAVKSKLKNDAVAIEFSHFNVLKDNELTGEVMYVAYVFNAIDEFPKVVPLFKESELKKAIARKSPDDWYSSDQLYNLIWQPIKIHLSKGNSIFYAPSGLLNQIAFAAITKSNNALVNQYKLIQLSSTYKLIEEIAPLNMDTTVLIGGITYDYESSNGEEAETTQKEDTFFLNNPALNKLRGTKSRGESWTLLEGAVDEIESLNSLLKQEGTSVSVLTKNEATEASFKTFSGQSPSLIHIATHGFFYENLNRDASTEFNLSTEDNYRLAEDPLLRSGLILAGANYAWKNGGNPNEEEDGILTAMEISNLDLSNTDLVVLSACKTGLGDIDGSEGVYGLQRAFKMAGVERLIMSLWEVPDEETSEFMKLFYNNWLQGTTLRDAFINTQRKMYLKYKKEPQKWAAFVLFE